MMYSCSDNLFVLNMIDLGGGWGGSQFDMYDASGNLVTSATLSNPLAAFDTLCLPDGCSMLCNSVLTTQVFLGT